MGQHQVVDLSITPIWVKNSQIVGYGFHGLVTHEVGGQLTRSEESSSPLAHGLPLLLEASESHQA